MLPRTTAKLIMYLVLSILAIAVVVWWLTFNFAKSRDYQRISDLQGIQSELFSYYSRYNTFIIPNCPPDSLLSDCAGSTEQPSHLGGFRDPLGGAPHEYHIQSLSEDDFTITAALEVGVIGLDKGSVAVTRDRIVSQ